MANVNLATKAKRMGLRARPDPYYQKLGKGRALGFRRGPDTWCARFRDATGKQTPYAIGSLAGQADEFVEAKRRAEDWFQQMGGGGHRAPRRGTVREALDAYIRDLREDQLRHDAADRYEKMFARAVYDDPIAGIRTLDVTLEDFKDWRKRLAEIKPVRARYAIELKQAAVRRLLDGESPKKLCAEYGMDKKTLYLWKREVAAGKTDAGARRTKQSVNRIVRQVKAAMKAATESLGFVGNPVAWSLKKMAEPDSERTRRVYYSAAQRARLIQFSRPIEQEFLRGLDFTAARPGELANARVADFDPERGQILFRSHKGKGAELRERATTLDSDALRFFKRHAKDKLPGAWLIIGPDGGPWKHHQWATGIRRALAAANAGLSETDRLYLPALKRKSCAYVFRHSRITDLINARTTSLIDVCIEAGTSLEMVHKHYYHLISTEMRRKLDAIKLRA